MIYLLESAPGGLGVRLTPYSDYKDSEVPWLGEIPGHWVVKPLKHWVKINAKALSEKTPQDYKFYYLDISSVGTGILTQKPQQVRFSNAPSRARRILHKGDTIFSTVRTYLKAVYFVADAEDTNPLIASTGFAVLTPGPNVQPKYLSYLVQSNAFTDRVSADSIGIAYPAIAETKVSAFHVAMPPLPEQSTIVRFLDHIDRRIRCYIRAKKKLIALLNEQKQAIIHRAVTRGLDPNVRFKPSGVEWLGEVPEHWEIRRNGQLFAQRNQTGFSELPILEVSLKTGVRVRNFENSTRKQVMSDRDKYKRAVKGDIAYNMMRMWQGAVGVAPVDGLVSPAYVVARPFEGIESRYFANLFRTAMYMGEVDKYSRGIVKDRNRLYWEDFKQMSSPCPPPDEQVRIADAIEQDTLTVSNSINRAMHGIDLIREYRTRLIADVVTGKLDVREAAARLPEQAEEDYTPEEGENDTDEVDTVDEVDGNSDQEETADE